MDEWVGRELDDCIKDATMLKTSLQDSLQQRQQRCVHPALEKLSNCLHLHGLLSVMCGERLSEGCPYNKLTVTMYGQEEFADLTDYVSSLKHIKEIRDISIHRAFAPVIYNDIKEAVASTVWGSNFSAVGRQMFRIAEGPLKGQTIADLAGDPFVESLQVADHNPGRFTPESQFDLKINTVESILRVDFQEEKLWEAFYTSQPLYTALKREGCIILDVAANIGGSEAIAETYYGIMTSQRKDNHLNDTLDMRTLVDFCIPNVSNCPEALSEISRIYLDGDLKNNIAKHRSQVFYDSRCRAARKYKVGKTIDNLRKEISRCSYIK